MSALTAVGLTRRFGDLVAVNNVSFEIPSGGVVGFVGPNGSGKSTTIRVMLGLIGASSGTGTVLGVPIEEPARFAGRVGALIENPAFVGSLSARDNLRSLAALRGLPSSRVSEVLDIVGLIGRENDRASTYSLGMKQRLGIAAALLPDPELLVLDEPTNGLDPAGIVEIRELLRGLAGERRTVVVSSHLLGEVEAMVDYIVVIRFGELLYSGTLDGLMAQATERVVVATEHASDVERLTSILEMNNWTWEALDGDLVVSMPVARVGDLDRAVNEAGFSLRLLAPQRDSLEAVFLNLTGATDAELTEQRSAQREGGVS